MLRRLVYTKAVTTALAANPVCALLGPRQCGKTTLARRIATGRASHYFDLGAKRTPSMNGLAWRLFDKFWPS